jgi:two-component system OmpR family sensor kinase
VVVFVFASGSWPSRIVPADRASVVLAVLSGIGAAAAALLWTAVARFTGDGRAAWGGAALAVYGVMAVPAMIIEATVETVQTVSGAAHAAVVMMLLIASLPSVRVAPRTGADLIGICVIVALGAGGMAVADPHVVAMWPPVRWAVVAPWAVAGALIAYRAAALGLRPIFRAGLGVVLLAFAHGYRIYSDAAQPTLSRAITFGTVRALAVAIVLSGATQLVRRGLRGIRAARVEHEEQLRMAEMGLERLAVREHELRNGIAGIAGATAALNGPMDDDDEASLRCVLAAEMARLEGLLNLQAAESGGSMTAAEEVCDAGDIVRTTVETQIAHGMDVRCDAPGELRVRGPAGVLTQVLLKLLANCARYAAGGPDGHTPRAGPPMGLGFGLYICRELVARYDGRIELRQSPPGCTVSIELPAADPVTRER